MISRSNPCLRGLSPLIAVSLFGCALPEGELAPEPTAELAGDSLALEASEDDARLANALAPNAALQEGDDLVISQEEWFTIQRYVTSSLALPQTDAQLRLWLKMGQTEDIAPFVPLQQSFGGVRAHAADWEQRIMPGTVDLAFDLINYADTASVFYQPLLDVIAVLRTTPNDPVARQDFIDLASALAEEASYYEQRAAAVELDLHAFATTLEGDEAELTRLSGDYEGQFGEQDGEIKRIREQIAEKRAELEKANQEYTHACKVAGTTPTYAWAVPPFGLIAASVVAGVYGDRAVKALNNIHQLEDQIAELDARAARVDRLLSVIREAGTGLFEIRNAVAGALPAIQAVRKSWDSMHADLEKIVRVMSTDIHRGAALAKSLHVKNALNEWEDVALKADGYVTNAYIKVQR
jgi:hypothetical protein